jgi:hypothetical protein|tara:strand:+ start:164 stop:640 length:477 start_codon:yes stop_codon:yes gene_type:complete
MIKVESILKWTVEGSLLKKLKLIRSQVLSKNPAAVAIPDKDLHVTLAAGPGWKKFKNQFKNIDFDEPDFKMDIEPNFKSITKGPKESWYIKMKNQQEWKDYVTDLFQENIDPSRIFHVSLANLTGKVGDSVALVESKNHHHSKYSNKHRHIKPFRGRR